MGIASVKKSFDLPILVQPRCQTQMAKSKQGLLLLKSKNTLPVFLHADDYPAILFCFIVELLCEGTDPRIWQTLSRSIRILTLRIVVEDQHRESRAVAGFGVFQHLAVTGRVAECGIGPASDHQVDALRLAGVVVV